jgi:hypothetical protein
MSTKGFWTKLIHFYSQRGRKSAIIPKYFYIILLFAENFLSWKCSANKGSSKLRGLKTPVLKNITVRVMTIIIWITITSELTKRLILVLSFKALFHHQKQQSVITNTSRLSQVYNLDIIFLLTMSLCGQRYCGHLCKFCQCIFLTWKRERIFHRNLKKSKWLKTRS